MIDGLGWTLYRSDADSAKPSKSACTGTCADEWPPVLMQAGTPDYEGVDPSVVGTITRDDGRQQVTIGGWPVYRHANDSAPGSVDGQGSRAPCAVAASIPTADSPATTASRTSRILIR